MVLLASAGILPPLHRADAAPATAAPQPVGETAEELLNRAMVSYNAGDFAGAEAAFSKFATDFASATETAEILPRVFPLLAICQVRLKKFAEASGSIDKALSDTSRIAPATLEELRFWRGVCPLEEKEYEEARKMLEAFLGFHPGSPKRAEARLLIATSLLLEDKYKEAAEACAVLSAELEDPVRGRAVVLGLYALVAAENWEGALKAILAEYPNLPAIPQIIGFQVLALQTGAAFLDAERYRDAIACLQRVWTKERLLKHQGERLEKLKIQLDAARERKAPASVEVQLTQLIAKVERETREFDAIEEFDAAVRFRLAMAFQGLERYREAGLVLSEMVGSHKPSPLVESAALNAIRCWLEIGRWDRAATSADTFLAKFPKSESLALVLFLKAQGLYGGAEFEMASAAFAEVADRYPKADVAPRAWFMAGFSLMMAEEYDRAGDRFADFPKRYPREPLADQALYWRGMAKSYAKDHAAAGELLSLYLKTFPKGSLRAEATYRRAYSRFALKEYETAIKEFRAFLREYPACDLKPESLILLGDALCALGKIDDGIAAYRAIPAEAFRFFEEGWFKIGKALKAAERFDDLMAHMEKFRTEHPESGRIAEAVYWVGWCHKSEDHPEKARTVYWETIRQIGDDEKAISVEELFLGLAKLYPDAEAREQLAKQFSDLAGEAAGAGKPRLATRARWAHARTIARTRGAASDHLLAEAGAAKEMVPPETSANLIADFADATLRTGDAEKAGKLYRELLKWNPRSPNRDRALAGLGLIARDKGDEETALRYFRKFAGDAILSTKIGEVLSAKAAIERRRGLREEARASLEMLLGTKLAGGRLKAEALVTLGELFAEQGEEGKAIPCYQRVYVMYSRWADLVAKAYLRSGEAFEKIHDSESAANTYREMLGREDLANFDETRAAKARLDKLEKRSSRT